MSPIGVFDSGVGGLTVVAALKRLVPGESILYLGDTARLPYGTKSAATVSHYTRRNLDFLVSRGVKAVVVACNTASALALGQIEEPVPLWGVIEPGARSALDVTRGRVGVIGTESTIRSDAYARCLKSLDPEVEVISQACPLFVSLVEEGWHDDPVALEVARRYLSPLVEQGIDTLVLGCTHYPLLESVIRTAVGDRIQLVDSAQAVATLVAGELERLDLRNDREDPEHHFCVTDNCDRFARIARTVLEQKDVSLELVEVV